MNYLYFKAFKLGASDFGDSDRRDKRFYVVYDNKIIHFGSRNGQTFYDHYDVIKKMNWYKRHSKIYDKNGVQVINNPYSPSYWSARLLW
jgi:phosphatidylserine/phosphatidylglycerophosphate/cardiolipin synthase-like enzyme